MVQHGQYVSETRAFRPLLRMKGVLSRVLHSVTEKVNGGLKMIDFGIMEIPLKISWIQRIQQNSDAGWKAIPERLLGDLGGP